MPPSEGHHHRRRQGLSLITLILIVAVSAFVVFQILWHQRLRQAVLEADPASVTQAASGAGGQQQGQQQQRTAGGAPSQPVALKNVPAVRQCHTEPHNEYHGGVVKWGEKNLQETADDCCKSCLEMPNCNAWVYCPEPKGCGDANNPRPHKECWLKDAPLQELFENVIGKAHAGISWTSGAVYTAAEHAAFEQRVKDKLKAEEARRKALRDDPDLPLVYLDVSIDGGNPARIEAVLFMKESPLAAENMRVFCSGEMGPSKHLKGAYFYRIIDRFIDQTGMETGSIYGGQFKDDAGGLKLQHDRPYLLSIANGGPNTNTAHFSITVAPAHHLDGHYVIFGECVSGFDVIEAVNALSRGQRNNELLHSKRAQIVDAGQLRRGAYRAPPTAAT